MWNCLRTANVNVNVITRYSNLPDNKANSPGRMFLQFSGSRGLDDRIGDTTFSDKEIIIRRVDSHNLLSPKHKFMVSKDFDTVFTVQRTARWKRVYTCWDLYQWNLHSKYKPVRVQKCVTVRLRTQDTFLFNYVDVNLIFIILRLGRYGCSRPDSNMSSTFKILRDVTPCSL
jgi:hypothetical protein